MARIPTLKQKKWAKLYMSGKPGSRAAMIAYETDNVRLAETYANKNLRSVAVRSLMEKSLNKAGLNDDQISEGIATVVKAGTSKRALTQTKPADALRGLELAARLKDSFPAEKRQVQSFNVNTELASKTDEELEKTLSDLIVEIRNFKKLTQQLPKRTPIEEGVTI